MTNTYTCKTESTTDCKSETRPDCKDISWQECRLVTSALGNLTKVSGQFYARAGQQKLGPGASSLLKIDSLHICIVESSKKDLSDIFTFHLVATSTFFGVFPFTVQAWDAYGVQLLSQSGTTPLLA